MYSIHPVLVVGTGDFSDLRAVLQEHGFGTLVAPSVDQARLMLQQFRVDAILILFPHPEDVKALAGLRTPLVLVGADPGPAFAVNCAAFVSKGVGLSAIPRIVARVINGGRGIYEGRGAA
jgi:DNA-binding LacI/PurR family transcriptional regulator